MCQCSGAVYPNDIVVSTQAKKGILIRLANQNPLLILREENTEVTITLSRIIVNNYSGLAAYRSLILSIAYDDDC